MLRILSINIWPMASRNAIGYMTEHLLNNEKLFDVMEIVTNNVEVYANVSEKYCVDINGLVIDVTEKKLLKDIGSDNKSATVKRIVSKMKMLYKFLLPIKIGRELNEKIIKFKPQVIYTQGYDIRILKLASKIAKKYSSKLVIHSLDDWFTCDDKTIEILTRKTLKKSLKTGLSFSGSPAMTERIQKLFSVDSKFIANCVDYDFTNSLDNNQFKYDIIYTGNLEPSRYTSLVNLGAALRENTKTKDLVIDVFSPKSQIDKYKSLFPENIILHEALPVEEVEKLIEASKIALHIETFEQEHQNFIMYSLSTKIAEYLSKGKPIVYYGPKNVGVARFLSEYDLGFVYDNVPPVIDKINQIITNYDYEQIAKKLMKKAGVFFDKTVVQNRVYEYCIKLRGIE